MKQLKAYKFRIYPSDEQKIFFSKTFGCVRLVYNIMLNDRIKAYEENKGNPDKKIKYPTPAKYKKEYEFLKEVDSLALANAQMNLVLNLLKKYKYKKKEPKTLCLALFFCRN